MQREIQSWSIIHSNKQQQNNSNQSAVWWLFTIGKVELKPFSHPPIPWTGNNCLSWCTDRQTQEKCAAVWWRSQSLAKGHTQMHLRDLSIFHVHRVTVPRCWQQWSLWEEANGCPRLDTASSSWLQWGTHARAEEECEKKGIAERSCCLLNTHRPHPLLHHSLGERKEESEQVKVGFREGGGKVLF